MSAENTPYILAYFFIPLPEPLSLHDGYTMEVRHQPSFDDYLAKIEQIKHGASTSSPDFNPSLHMSCRFWQRDYSDTQTVSVVDEVLETATDAMPGIKKYVKTPGATESATKSLASADKSSDNKEDAARDAHDSDEGAKKETRNPVRSHLTVAEVVLPISDNSEASISSAFDEAINSLRKIQRAYYVVRRQPLTLVTRERLPWVIPYGVRCITEENDQWPKALQLLHINNRLPFHPRSQDLNKEEIEMFNLAFHAQPGLRVFASHIDLLRHAQNAFFLDGDYRAAVIFAAASVEILFNDLLAHMMWEENMRPENAAPIFDKGGLQTRVRTQFHTRLGGKGWGLDVDGIPRNWQQKVAAIRHRVVHAGYEPTYKEAQDAVITVSEVQEFLIELLINAVRLKNYPITAMSLLGKSGLEKRNKWNTTMEQLASDKTQPDWIMTFNHWKETMYLCREEQPPGTIQPVVANAVTILIIYPGGVLNWVLHDRDAMKAHRALLPTNLSPQQTDAITKLAAQHANTESASSCMFADVSSALMPGCEWVPDYHLIPLARVMHNGNDLDPPYQ